MPRGAPKMREHATGQAVVRIAGKDHYLGVYGTQGAQERYGRLLSSWIAVGRPRVWDGPAADPRVDACDVMVGEVCTAYLAHARSYYRKGGSPTSHFGAVRVAIEALANGCGEMLVADFGARALRDLRASLVDRDRRVGVRGDKPRAIAGARLSRETVNRYVSIIVRAFRWAASEEIIPASVHAGLATVPGLRRGRSAAAERAPVLGADPAAVEAAAKHMAPAVHAMVELQLLTAMRPGEVVAMRAGDLDRSGAVWTLRPASHKTDHHGHARVVYFGPKAQAVLEPFLAAHPKGALFRGRRRVPYLPGSYRSAVVRACASAGVPRWTPNQLRHTAATRIRREYGLDVAQVILGHAGADVTQVYAEADRARAERVIGEIG